MSTLLVLDGIVVSEVALLAALCTKQDCYEHCRGKVEISQLHIPDVWTRCYSYIQASAVTLLFCFVQAMHDAKLSELPCP